MISAIFSTIVSSITGWLMEKLLGKSPAATPSVEEKLGRAEVQLENEVHANEVHQTAARARSAARKRLRDKDYDVDTDSYLTYRD